MDGSRAMSAVFAPLSKCKLITLRPLAGGSIAK
jgi:hypothetical protein